MSHKKKWTDEANLEKQNLTCRSYRFRGGEEVESQRMEDWRSTSLRMKSCAQGLTVDPNSTGQNGHCAGDGSVQVGERKKM